jgi:hypothetical protein
MPNILMKEAAKRIGEAVAIAMLTAGLQRLLDYYLPPVEPVAFDKLRQAAEEEDSD